MNNGTAAGTAHMHDAAIIGGGLVGASLALALQRAGLQVQGRPSNYRYYAKIQ